MGNTFLTAVVGAIGTAVAALLIANAVGLVGPSNPSSPPSGSGSASIGPVLTPSPETVTDTELRLFRPFGDSGELRGNYQLTDAPTADCWDSLLTRDPAAFRCAVDFSDDTSSIVDPCWQNHFSSEFVCPLGPWDGEKAVFVERGVVDEDLPPEDSPDSLYWAMEIIDPRNGERIRCTSLGGTRDVLEGVGRLNQGCSDTANQVHLGDVIGVPNETRKLWRVFFNPVDSSEVLRADVAIVWR
jgi:hypothetical protein